MEWRCEWCGKPHEENDPPCDNCGHGSFERAVAPVAPEGEGGPTVWICTECGKDHPRNNPPCSRCGSMTLQQREQTFEEGDAIGPEVEVDGADGDATEGTAGSDTMTVWVCADCGKDHPRNNPPCGRCGGMHYERRELEFGEDGELAVDPPGSVAEPESPTDPAADATDPARGSTTVWACTECGRSHTRYNPPCSRCGNMQFEQREQRFDDAELSSGGWRDAVDTKVVLGFLAAFALLVLLVGTSLGFITLPGQGIPGESETAAGLDLATVESEYVTGLNERRSEAGLQTLSGSEGLDERATWYNEQVVRAVHADGQRPSREEIGERFAPLDECSRTTYLPFAVGPGELPGGSLESVDSETELAATLLDGYRTRFGEEYDDVSDGFVGVDVHVGPDGAVFVTQVVC